MDALASIVVDVVLETEKLPTTLNVVHPHRATWRNVLNGVNTALGAHLPCRGDISLYISHIWSSTGKTVQIGIAIPPCCVRKA